MDAPSFIERNGETIISEMVAFYEGLTGRTVQPGQAERLLINAFAYRELMVREQIQAVGEQMLVSFASAPALDYLGELLGVTRLSASGASTVIEFTLVSGHTGVVIPAGLRVGSADGKTVFTVPENISVPAGETSAESDVFCETLGVVGNGYAIGDISEILDPQAFLESATNVSETTGGADAETDDELRARIKLAPSQFSVAGPRDAYIFFAKSASVAIIDVAVLSTVPGTVNIYPLIAGGEETPTEILNLVFDVCNDEKVRPLTDTVVVESPTFVEYEIEIEITIYSDADSEAVEAAATLAVENYRDARAKRLGLDIIVSQLVALATVDVNQVYNVNVISPASDVVLDATEVGKCTSLSVTVTGENDG